MVKPPKQSIHLKKTASQSIQKATIKLFYIEICINLPNLREKISTQILKTQYIHATIYLKANTLPPKFKTNPEASGLNSKLVLLQSENT